MKIAKKLRHFWHDVYYALASELGVEFAMRCKEVAEKIDLGEMPATRMGRFRFWLHLSLCQACKNYSDASHALKRALYGFIRSSEKTFQIERLNKELFKKHAQKKDLPQ